MKNNLPNYFLLLGPEEGEKSQFIKNIIKNLTQQKGEKPEVLRYYFFEINLVDFISQMYTGSLFSAHRVIILNGIEDLKIANEVKLLNEYLENTAEDVTLFLISSQIGKVNKTLEKNIPSNQKKIFWELYDHQKRNWIQNFFNQRELFIDPQALDYLLEIVENNTRDLKAVCQHLAFFYNTEKNIKVEDIEQYVYHSREENIFTLFEKIINRDFQSAQEALLKMIQSESSDNFAVSVVIGLNWQIKKLLRLKLMLEKQNQNSQIFKKLSITAKKSQNIYLKGASNYSEKELIGILILLNDYDLKIRSFNKDAHLILLQSLLYFIVIKGGYCKSY